MKLPVYILASLMLLNGLQAKAIQAGVGEKIRTRSELLALGLPAFQEQKIPVLLMKENSGSGNLVEFIHLDKGALSYERIQGSTDGKLYVLRSEQTPKMVKLAIVNWMGSAHRFVTLHFSSEFTGNKVYVISGLGHEVYGWARGNGVSESEENKVKELQKYNEIPFHQRTLKIEALDASSALMVGIGQGSVEIRNNDIAADIVLVN